MRAHMVFNLPRCERGHVIAPSGTHYDASTPEDVVRVLETYMGRDTRLRLHYGDTETGQDWGDVYDVAGRIGCSMGSCRVPLLLHNARSIGGGAILTRCIVRIRFANRAAGGDLYRHAHYKRPALTDDRPASDAAQFA